MDIEAEDMSLLRCEGFQGSSCQGWNGGGWQWQWHTSTCDIVNVTGIIQLAYPNAQLYTHAREQSVHDWLKFTTLNLMCWP